MDEGRMVRTILRLFAILGAVGSLHLQAGRQATATASVTGGFVSGIVVTDGGAGYQVAPAVLIAGGGGNGASAVALLTGDQVSAVVVTVAGNGYSTPPSVTIAPPPDNPASATLSIDTVPRITVSGSPGSTNLIEWADAVGSPTVWHRLTNFALGSGPTVIIDPTVPEGGRRIYRVVSTNGEPPGRPPGFVWIPPGRFMMGSPANEEGRQASEALHPVVISRGFWISATEATAGQYGAVTKTNPGNQTDARLPVYYVTWMDATNYCAKLTQIESAAGRLPAGYYYRLPTEAEWEYAARGGTQTAYSFGDSPAELSRYAADPGIQPVGTKLKNANGLHDVHGNVAEWCLDSMVPYALWEVTDPWGVVGEDRVIRGGYSGAHPVLLRSASRAAPHINAASFNWGFRPVLAQAP